MPDTQRPVWIDSLGADTLRYYAARAESSADQAFLYGLADAWDAAPADPTEAVARAIVGPNGKAVEIDIEMTYDVLRALGAPDA